MVRTGRGGHDKKKLLLYTIVCGSKQKADSLFREMPSLFSTIEDFLWFRLAMIGARSSAEELQTYLTKFQPSHYTKNGKDSLVYPYVLLLSLQFHAAGVYMMKEDTTVDSVHIALTVADFGCLSEGNAVVACMEAASEIASIIRHYALTYVKQGNLALALEYYVQAAATVGGGVVVWSGQCSREQHRQHHLLLKLLVTDGGISFLLGSKGAGVEGSLRRFISDPQNQRSMLLEAARQCQESGSHDKFTAFRTSCRAAQMAFRQLESILLFYRFTRSGRFSDTLTELAKLAFLPLATRTPESCAESLRYTSLSRQACVPDLLREAPTCLDQVHDADGTVRRLKKKVANFIANSLPRNLPQEPYDRVAQIM